VLLDWLYHDYQAFNKPLEKYLKRLGALWFLSFLSKKETNNSCSDNRYQRKKKRSSGIYMPLICIKSPFPFAKNFKEAKGWTSFVIRDAQSDFYSK